MPAPLMLNIRSDVSRIEDSQGIALSEGLASAVSSAERGE